MANVITNQQIDNQMIKMSNATTSVFFETLCVSGSDLAEESFKKDLLIWFGQRD